MKQNKNKVKTTLLNYCNGDNVQTAERTFSILKLAERAEKIFNLRLLEYERERRQVNFFLLLCSKTILRLLTNLLNVASLATSIHLARLVIALSSRSIHCCVAVCIPGVYTPCEVHINNWKHNM